MAKMTFYSNFSKRENSTKQPTGGTEYNIAFKDNFSILGGKVLINIGLISAQAFKEALFSNYYYFVTDAVTVTNDVTELTLSLDYLATYRSNIAAYRGLITRCPKGDLDTNNVFKDDKIQPLSNYILREKNINLLDPAKSICYQVRFKSTYLNEIYYMDTVALLDLAFKLDEITSTIRNLGDAVESVLAVPISINLITGQATNQVHITTKTIEINNGTVVRVTVPGTVTIRSNIIDFTNTYFRYTDFRKYDEDFTKLAVVYNGTSTDIPTGVLRGNLQYSFEMDIFSLDTRFELKLYTDTGMGANLIYSSTGNLGIPYSIGFGNTVSNALKIATIAASQGIASSRGITSTQGFTSSLGATASQGVTASQRVTSSQGNTSHESHYKDFSVSGTRAAFSVLTNLSDITRTSTVPASASSYFAWELLTTFKIVITQYGCSPESVVENGYPVLVVTDINYFKTNGFYKFENPNIEISANQSIRVLINNALQAGIYYE